MPPPNFSEEERLQRERFTTLLRLLSEQGIRQSDAAHRLNMPAQYISDVKSGRRAMTELFARRLAEEFKFDYMWLLGQQGSSEPSETSVGASAPTRLVQCLPLYPHPICGDPWSQKNWNGETFDVAGPAAAKILTADWPFVLRFGADDRCNVIKKNDCLLISQTIEPEAEVQVLQDGSRMLLARRIGNKWEPVSKTARLKDRHADRAGYCIGIVWRQFS